VSPEGLASRYKPTLTETSGYAIANPTYGNVPEEYAQQDILHRVEQKRLLCRTMIAIFEDPFGDVVFVSGSWL
jgi:hypothetical protein